MFKSGSTFWEILNLNNAEVLYNILPSQLQWGLAEPQSRKCILVYLFSSSIVLNFVYFFALEELVRTTDSRTATVFRLGHIGQLARPGNL
jgi:hypothetical protein